MCFVTPAGKFPVGGRTEPASSARGSRRQPPRSDSAAVCGERSGGPTSRTMVDPSKYVAMDCEMVGLGHGGLESALARCSIVDYSGKVIYDKFIKPDGTITDYRTDVSGIRPLDMDTALPYHVAREEILKILEGKIIVGHDPRSDFRVLRMDIASYTIRDTSSCRLLITKAMLKTDRRASLKTLCQKLLGKRIQSSLRGHSSVEDASAAMELFKLVENLWEVQLTKGTKVEIVNRFEKYDRY